MADSNLPEQSNSKEFLNPLAGKRINSDSGYQPFLREYGKTISEEKDEINFARTWNRGARSLSKYSKTGFTTPLIKYALNRRRVNDGIEELERKYVKDQMSASEEEELNTIQSFKSMIRYLEKMKYKIDEDVIAGGDGSAVANIRVKLHRIRELLMYLAKSSASNYHSGKYVGDTHVKNYIPLEYKNDPDLNNILDIIGDIDIGFFAGGAWLDNKCENLAEPYSRKFVKNISDNFLNTESYDTDEKFTELIEKLKAEKKKYNLNAVNRLNMSNFCATINSARAGKFDEEFNFSYVRMLQNKYGTNNIPNNLEEELCNINNREHKELTKEAFRELILNKTVLEDIYKKKKIQEVFDSLREFAKINNIEQEKIEKSIEEFMLNFLEEVKKVSTMVGEKKYEHRFLPNKVGSVNIKDLEIVDNYVDNRIKTYKCKTLENILRSNLSTEDSVKLDADHAICDKLRKVEKKALKYIKSPTAKEQMKVVVDVAQKIKGASKKKCNVLGDRIDCKYYLMYTSDPGRASDIFSIKQHIENLKKSVSLLEARLKVLKKAKKKKESEISDMSDRLRAEKYTLEEERNRLKGLQRGLNDTLNFSSFAIEKERQKARVENAKISL